MNRAQALREIELLENYEFDKGDAPARLLVHLRSSDQEIILAALRAAVNYFGLPGIYEEVFRMARSAEDEEVRAMANNALWPVLQEGAPFDWPSEPAAPGEEPEELGDPAVPREVYEATKNHLLERVDAPMESMEVRRRCLEALGHLAFLPEVRSIILRFYHSAPNPWVRTSAVFAMGLHRDEVFEQHILEELHSRHQSVMLEAIHSAANLGLEVAWPRIQELISEGDREVRGEAIAAIGLVAPLEEAEEAIKACQAKYTAKEYAEPFEYAIQSLEQRRQETAEDGWSMDRVWSEIDEMTEGFDDEDEYDRPGPSF